MRSPPRIRAFGCPSHLRFRVRGRGLENILSAAGALVVSNHSGGMFAMDVPILAIDYYQKFGYDRPIYTLSHDMLMTGPTGTFFKSIGSSAPTTRTPTKRCAPAARGGVPRRRLRRIPTHLSENTIDFGGRTGYIRTAINAGVPIVPAVGIGGQESQLFLSRGPGWPSLIRSRGCTRQDRADLVRLPVRAECGRAPNFRCRRRSSCRCCRRSTSSPSSARPRHRRGRRARPTRDARGAQRPRQGPSPTGAGLRLAQHRRPQAAGRCCAPWRAGQRCQRRAPAGPRGLHHPAGVRVRLAHHRDVTVATRRLDARRGRPRSAWRLLRPSRPNRVGAHGDHLGAAGSHLAAMCGRSRISMPRCARPWATTTHRGSGIAARGGRGAGPG